MYDTPLPRYNQLEIIGISMGTYKVQNEIETKRNQRKRNETKSTKTKRNETNETNESKTD
jgi:hypothetical protein